MAPILDEVMSTQKELDLQQFEPSRFVQDLIEQLDERSKTIISRRFGLDGSKPRTLESLGKQYGVTRERVRQIESLTLRELRRGPNGKRIAHVSGLIHSTLADAGGVMEQESLLKNLLGEDSVSATNGAALLFLLNLSDEVQRFDENERFKTMWASNRIAYDRLNSLLDAIERVFTKEKKTLNWEALKKALTAELPSDGTVPTDSELQSVLAITKRIAKNPFAEYGLTEWSAVVPKGVRDKAYLVLQRAKSPLHFVKITESINQAKFDGRKAYPQTVHNELIKDRRFVLVGRGTYGLSEWGYKPGTVAEVLVEVLREHSGPMQRDELLKEVLRRRMVKRNTVLIGLQDKARFKRVDRQTYDLVARN